MDEKEEVSGSFTKTIEINGNKIELVADTEEELGLAEKEAREYSAKHHDDIKEMVKHYSTYQAQKDLEQFVKERVQK